MKSLKIYGPPGTGKTHTLLGLFEDELKEFKPDKIGFVTFTRAAKAEVLSRSSLTEDELPFVKTLHSTCYKALKIDQNQLVLRKDLVAFGRSIGVHLTGFMPDLFSLEAVTDKWQQPTKADRLLQLNHLGRHRGLKLKETLKDAPQELDFKYAAWFTKSYRDWKTANGKSDYTDLLQNYLSQGDELDLDVLFVDEAQDLSWLQWQVVHKLGIRAQRLYLAGDDDQAIFNWAGASAAMFNLEPTDESKVLPYSYRLAREIHSVGQKIIRRVKVRHEKEFRPRDADGEYRPIGQLDLSHLGDSSTLVLYRNFHRGTALGLQLEDLGIPFSGANAPLSNPEVQQALAGWVKVQENHPIPVAEAKAMVGFATETYLEGGVQERLGVKTGEFSATALFKATAFEQPWHHIMPKLPRLSYLVRAAQRGGMKSLLTPTIQLLSIHQAKGREASTVVLDLEMARRTHESYMREPDDEHRVWYVAVTRAKNRLLTLLPSDPMSYSI